MRIDGKFDNTVSSGLAKRCIQAALMLCLLYVVPDQRASAETPRLWQGMSQAQVLKLKGPALERIEYETKRQEKWLYPEEELGFREGRLFTWWNAHVDMFAHLSQPPRELYATKPAKAELQPSFNEKKQSKQSNKPERIQNLLQEVFRDLPSDAPTSSVPAGPGLMK